MPLLIVGRLFHLSPFTMFRAIRSTAPSKPSTYFSSSFRAVHILWSTSQRSSGYLTSNHASDVRLVTRLMRSSQKNGRLAISLTISTPMTDHPNSNRANRSRTRTTWVMCLDDSDEKGCNIVTELNSSSRNYFRRIESPVSSSGILGI
jgi:hypothetical protein